MAPAYLSDYLPYAGMVSDGVIVTKDALLMRTFYMRGHDLSYAADHEITEVLRAINHSLRLLDEGWTLYVDAVRRLDDSPDPRYSNDAPPTVREFEQEHTASLGTFFRSEFYLTFVYSIEEKKGLNKWLFQSDTDPNSIHSDLATFRNITDDIYNLYRDQFRTVTPLNSDELLTYIHGTLSRWHPVLTPDVPWHLDVYLSDAKVTVDTDCTVDEDHVVTASVHDVPGETHAGMVSRIMQAPFEFRLVTRYTFLSDATAKGKIKTIRRTQFQKRKGVGAMFSEAATGEKTEVEDTDATNLAAEASDALEALTDPVTKFGYLTTSIVVRDPNYRRAVQRLDELRKLVNDEGFIVKQETFGNPFVFLGSLPGNISYNARQPMLSTKNLAHHYPISQPWEGDYRNDHLYHLTGADWPHIAARAGNSPFFVNLNYGDVGHTFVVGPTGSGKSILLNTLAIQWLRYPDTRVVFFDKDRTSRPATINTGGSFYDLGSDDAGLLLNPFADIHDPGHRAWLSQFLAHYLRDKQIDVSTRDENELHAAVEHMATLEPDALKFETFRDNIQHEEIRAALHPFIEGEYAHLFTSDSDTIAQNRWTTFEMGTLMTMDEYIVRFVLAYLFQKLSRIFGGTPTLMLLDESFMYLDNPTFRTMLRDWLKVLRKQHVYVALATQDIADVANSPIFSTVLNACQTRILLPNPRAMEGTNYELYQAMGLTDGDILGLRDARNKREYFYVSPKGKQLFELNLNPTQLDILERVRTEHLESGIT